MHESWPYKRDLLIFAASFRQRIGRQVWRDSSLEKAEKILFVGFYFVRKLIENRKVTDACIRNSVAIQRAFIRRSRQVSDFMRHDLEKDLQNAEFVETKVDVNQLCDKVVHAWWCIPIQGEDGGLAGYVLTTDKKKNAEFWFVPSESIVEVFTRFAESDIKSLKKKRDDNGRLVYWRAE